MSNPLSTSKFEVRDLRNKEWFVVDDIYLNGWARKCGIYATGVYFVLCRHANIETQSCFPSVSLISQKLDISERQVKRALSILEHFHIIRVERTSGKVNVYYLLDKREWIDTRACQSPVSNSHHTSACQSPAPVTDRPPKDINLKRLKKDISNSNDLDVSFSSFWQVYPKREAKQAAIKAWQKLNPDSSLVTKILFAIDAQKKHKENLKQSNAFTPEWPYPATWLNGHRWDDEINDQAIQQSTSPSPDSFSCPRCGRHIIVKSDLTSDGCVYCETMGATA